MYNNVIAYAVANGKKEEDLAGLFLLQDKSDGNGPFIAAWDVPGLQEPTKAELKALETEAQQIQAKREYKELRQKLLDELTVTTTAGNIFDADEVSQERMARAIVALDDGEQIKWRMADDSEPMIDKAELKEALKRAGQAQIDIWFPS